MKQFSLIHMLTLAVVVFGLAACGPFAPQTPQVKNEPPKFATRRAAPPSGATAAPTRRVFGAADVGLSDADKKTILDGHNAIRATYKLAALTWDDNLASFAKDWADQRGAGTATGHRPDDQNPNQYGENIWAGTSGAYPITAAVTGWGDEVKDYNLTNNTCADGKVCGHFTQVVWFATTKVGCGKAKGADGWDYVVCNYDPAGNFTGQSPFGP